MLMSSVCPPPNVHTMLKLEPSLGPLTLSGLSINYVAHMPPRIACLLRSPQNCVGSQGSQISEDAKVAYIFGVSSNL